MELTRAVSGSSTQLPGEAYSVCHSWHSSSTNRLYPSTDFLPVACSPFAPQHFSLVFYKDFLVPTPAFIIKWVFFYLALYFCDCGTHAIAHVGVTSAFAGKNRGEARQHFFVNFFSFCISGTLLRIMLESRAGRVLRGRLCSLRLLCSAVCAHVVVRAACCTLTQLSLFLKGSAA